MSRLLSPEEIEALLSGGPLVETPGKRPRLGDPVEVLIDGKTVAHGRLVSWNGRLCVRVESLEKAGEEREA